MTCHSVERRRSVRRTRLQEHGIQRARIRPGYETSIVDISAGGALLDTSHRLLPGASAEILLSREARGEGESVRGRVLRCAVVGVRSNAMTYRAAIAFGHSVTGLEPGG